MAVSAASVKELREKTGAGMLDCKKALEQSGGDLDKAVDILREKGLSAAAKKAGVPPRKASSSLTYTRAVESACWWKSTAKRIL